jgi:hypothetical protein
MATICWCQFEQVKVDLTPVLQLMIPLPNFPLLHEGEDDAQLLARVEQEARNIVGGYTHAEDEACIASLPNNSRLNHVLEIVGVSYGPHPMPVSTAVLKKRKVGDVAKVLGMCLKVTEKKATVPAMVSGSCTSADSKWPSGADNMPAKSAKLSMGMCYAGNTRIGGLGRCWRC